MSRVQASDFDYRASLGSRPVLAWSPTLELCDFQALVLWDPPNHVERR